MVRSMVLHAEDIDRQHDESFHDPERGRGVLWKTIMSSSKTPTNTFTSGIATCAPGDSILCPHQHKQAEMYFITHGEGVVVLDDVEHPVKKGSVVFIADDSKHSIRNASDARPLVWLYVFAVDDFSEIKYRFPAKL